MPLELRSFLLPGGPSETLLLLCGVGTSSPGTNPRETIPPGDGQSGRAILRFTQRQSCSSNSGSSRIPALAGQEAETSRVPSM